MDFFILSLAVLLIGLKLTDRIDWTWGKVVLVSLSPLVFLFVVGMFLGALSVGLTT